MAKLPLCSSIIYCRDFCNKAGLQQGSWLLFLSLYVHLWLFTTGHFNINSLCSIFKCLLLYSCVLQNCWCLFNARETCSFQGPVHRSPFISYTQIAQPMLFMIWSRWVHLRSRTDVPNLLCIPCTEELKEKLTEYVDEVNTRKSGFIKVVRHNKQEGLIRSRVSGWRAATAPVVALFDAHVEFNVGWYVPCCFWSMSFGRVCLRMFRKVL